MDDLKALWSTLSPESDSGILILMWAIAFYLYFNQLHWSWSQQLTRLFGVPQTESDDTHWVKQSVVLVLSLVPFLVMGLAGHLFFLWGFGHIWSVSLAIFGCISGGIYELIRQNDTLGPS